MRFSPVKRKPQTNKSPETMSKKRQRAQQKFIERLTLAKKEEYSEEEVEADILREIEAIRYGKSRLKKGRTKAPQETLVRGGNR